MESDMPLVSTHWIKKFDNVENEFAREVLNRLEKSGIAREFVFTTLYLYTHRYGPRGRRLIAAEYKRLRKRMKQAKAELEQLANNLERATITGLRTSNEDAAIHSVRATAQHLGDLMKDYRRTSSLRGKHRWEEGLACLSIEIERVCGECHWSDLAYLLDAAYDASGVHRSEITPGSVKKGVVRFQERHPEITGQIGARPASSNRKRSSFRRTRNYRSNQKPSVTWPYTDH